jgi:hypothetical protein
MIEQHGGTLEQNLLSHALLRSIDRSANSSGIGDDGGIGCACTSSRLRFLSQVSVTVTNLWIVAPKRNPS